MRDLSRMAGSAAMLAVLVGWAATAAAQDSGAESNLSQSESGADQAGQTAPVGAGSSDAVTTGVSGPDAGAPAGEIAVPPVPGDDLCEDYAGQPAYEPCLMTVTGERNVQ